jgi:hypothetical protein
LVALLSACDLPATLLTDAERSSIYTFDVRSTTAKLDPGTPITAGSTLALVIGSSTGAREPESVNLNLLDAKGRAIASLAWAKAGTSRSLANSSAIILPSLVGRLGDFRLPASLEPGFYRLKGNLDPGTGKTQDCEFAFFVPSPDWQPGGILVSPSIPVVASRVLLLATISASSASPSATAEQDRARLWLRWSEGGKVFAEGPLSGGFDRVVWTLPGKEGATTLRLDFYPGPPPTAAYDLASPWFQNFTVIAKGAAVRAVPAPFANAARYHSLFAFEGDLADSGARTQAVAPVIFGTPFLEAYPEGFGYRLGSESGIHVPRLDFNAVGKGSAFSIALLASVESSSGTLFSLRSASGGRLALGFDPGGIWLETPGSEGPAILETGRILEQGTHGLMLSIRKEGDAMLATLTLDGEPRFQATVPAFAPVFAELDLGGVGAASAIWDAFGLCYDDATKPPPQIFASSVARINDEAFIAAEGFEGPLGPAFQLRGKAQNKVFSLALAAGSSLALASSVQLAPGLRVEARLLSGSLGFLVEDLKGSPLLAVAVDGSVTDGAGRALGSIKMDPASFWLGLRAGEAGCELIEKDGASLKTGIQLPKDFRPVLTAPAKAVLESIVILAGN